MSLSGAPVSVPMRAAAAWPLVASAIACVLVAVFAAWRALAVTVGNVDVSALLVLSSRLVAGERLYIDVVEVNPPFSTWLYMPYALAEHASGIAAEYWMALGLSVLALTSIGICAAILARTGVYEARRYLWLAPFVAFVLLGLVPGDYGQREQFAVIALLPWLALLAARARSDDFVAGTGMQRIAAGFGAAVFVMTKPPYAALALALPVLLLCLWRRSLRPLFTTETLLGAAVTCSYVAYLVLFDREFFTDVLPLLRDAYMPVRRPVMEMLAMWPVVTFVGLAVTAFAAARPAGIDADAKVLLLAALGYVPVFVLMGKGWSYQALPILSFGLLALLLQLWRSLDAARPILAKVGAIAGALVAFQLIVSQQLSAQWLSHSGPAKARDAIVSVVRAPTIATIATRVQPAHPLTRLVDGSLVSRHPALWMVGNAEFLIHAGVSAAHRARLETLRDAAIADVAAELKRLRPDIIIADGTGPIPGQVAIRANPAIAAMLGAYRVLYRDVETTVFVRSDIAIAGSTPAAGPATP